MLEDTGGEVEVALNLIAEQWLYVVHLELRRVV
jgi:hypothetical protein